MTNETLSCNLYQKQNRSGGGGGGGIIHIGATYGGLPQNLATNAILLSILLIAFLILRKSAWRVLNHLVRRDDLDKWSHVFFTFAHQLANVPSRTNTAASQSGVDQEQLTRNQEQTDSEVRSAPPSRPPLERRGTVDGPPQSFLEWLLSTFTLNDAEIKARCGNDALQYLRYQRHIMAFLGIITILSLVVILPLNFMGTLQGDKTSFGHTTMVNLDPNSNLLWVHICFSLLFFPLATIVMRHFSVDVRFRDISLEVSRTVMIEKIPKAKCNKALLKQHFKEAFPRVKIEKLTFAFDVKKLCSINEDIISVKSALKYCERYDPAEKLELYPSHCSRFCCCFCCCCQNKLKAKEFYQEELNRLQEEFDLEKEKALQTPLGIAFVTLRTVNEAKNIYDKYQTNVFKRHFNPPESSLTPILKTRRWEISFATTPDDIYWENLTPKRQYLLFKKIVINTLLFFITFFLTTPEYVVSQSDFVVKFVGEDLKIPSWIVDFLPTLLLWSFTALLPLLVAWSDRFLGHWTRSAENHAIMNKTFWFLLFMVIFLPTFGFTTADATFKFLFAPESSNDTYRWECVFLPDSGAFFVNYIITAAFVGAGLELLRVPELLWYFCQVCWSRSEAEKLAIRRSIKYEFRFGEQYARMMLMFCMTIMFSLSCPLITPFGFIFFVTKHYVDRHNFLYAYKPSKINKKVHSNAIYFVIMSVIVLQFFMMIFTVIRGGSWNDLSIRSKVMIGIFAVCVNIFSAQFWPDTCKRVSAIEYVEATMLREDEQYDSNFTYLPDVLKNSEADEDVETPKEETRAKFNLRQMSDDDGEISIDRQSNSETKIQVESNNAEDFTDLSKIEEKDNEEGKSGEYGTFP